MKLTKLLFAGLFLASLTISCEKDDDEIKTVPDRDRGEQELDDQAALEEYLQTHFYNYEEFENPGSNFDYAVRLDTIDGLNADKTPLIESEFLEKKTVDLNDVEYTIYILKAQPGVKGQAKFADSTLVTYRGELLNGDFFDGSSTPVWFDLVEVIPGFRESLTEFKGASGYQVNPDNTVSWNTDFGVGTIFMPSGLGYFSTPRTTIPAYSPLIFNIQLLSVNESDHDGDGIPSYLEDIDENGSVTNDDSDGDRVPNYGDADDDGDFTPTRDEIEVSDEGVISYPDTNEDGIPDYLDPTTY